MEQLISIMEQLINILEKYELIWILLIYFFDPHHLTSDKIKCLCYYLKKFSLKITNDDKKFNIFFEIYK